MTKLIIFLSFFVMCNMLSAQEIPLPAPNKTGGKPLMQVLNQRKSTRTYQSKELTVRQISELLWAANGFNRADKRTVPTANNKQELELYVATKSALYFYDARNHQLIEVLKGDFREKTGSQDFVAKAALNLIYVSDLNKASSREYAFTSCGFVAQNVYLYCASEGLGSVVRGMFNKEELSKLLKLKPNQEVLLTQTVGWPE